MAVTESIPHLLNVIIGESSRAGYYLELFIAADNGDLDLITCPICREALFEPVRTECGHSFCLACIQATIDNNPPFGYKVNPSTAKGRCPVDRLPISVVFKRDLEMEKTMLCRKVKCALYTRGCEWTGSLLMLETHLMSDCARIRVKCENAEFVERRDLSALRECD